VANVWDAIKKHQAEQEQQRAAADQVSAETEAAPREAWRVAPAADASPAPAPAPASRDAKAPALQAPPVIQSVGAAQVIGHNGSFSEVLVTHHDRGGRITEEYRSLRTHLLAQYPDERFCLLITSALAGEGKTVTAANLAMVMAERIDRKTILVDCDLRKKKLTAMLGCKQQAGMADLLQGKAALRDVIVPTVYPNLFFLPPGTTGGNVGELMGRPELVEIVAELRRKYDYVLFDTPPINVVSHAGILSKAANEALLVVRMHRTHRESVDKAVRLLHATNAKLVGLVLTHRRFIIPSYLYRYS